MLACRCLSPDDVFVLQDLDRLRVGRRPPCARYVVHQQRNSCGGHGLIKTSRVSVIFRAK